MGYWQTDTHGNSFADDSDGTEHVWGDGPADAFDDAIAHARQAFLEEVGREPTYVEMLAGFRFSLGCDCGCGRVPTKFDAPQHPIDQALDMLWASPPGDDQ